ncbi:MAG: hypothetical protein AVDCRST_MAG89-3622, partial [uncultured Gemmatimonadetes bacterium]
DDRHTSPGPGVLSPACRNLPRVRHSDGGQPRLPLVGVVRAVAGAGGADRGPGAVAGPDVHRRARGHPQEAVSRPPRAERRARYAPAAAGRGAVHRVSEDPLLPPRPQSPRRAHRQPRHLRHRAAADAAAAGVLPRGVDLLRLSGRLLRALHRRRADLSAGAHRARRTDLARVQALAGLAPAARLGRVRGGPGLSRRGVVGAGLRGVAGGAGAPPGSVRVGVVAAPVRVPLRHHRRARRAPQRALASPAAVLFVAAAEFQRARHASLRSQHSLAPAAGPPPHPARGVPPQPGRHLALAGHLAADEGASHRGDRRGRRVFGRPGADAQM